MQRRSPFAFHEFKFNGKEYRLKGYIYPATFPEMGRQCIVSLGGGDTVRGKVVGKVRLADSSAIFFFVLKKSGEIIRARKIQIIERRKKVDGRKKEKEKKEGGL